MSHSLEAAICVDGLEEARRRWERPVILNTDQGAQFTSEAFTEVLERAGVAISLDGRGRALDNIFVERLWRSVKHEDVYLKGYTTMTEARSGLGEYFTFYNGERPHQGLNDRMPDEVYGSGRGGGAKIADKFGALPGQHRTAA